MRNEIIYLISGFFIGAGIVSVVNLYLGEVEKRKCIGYKLDAYECQQRLTTCGNDGTWQIISNDDGTNTLRCVCK